MQETRGYDLSQYAEELPLCEAFGSVWFFIALRQQQTSDEVDMFGEYQFVVLHSSLLGGFRHLVGAQNGW